MDIIVLGLLMMQQSTIYELKQYIGKFLVSVSGNGTGSIQAAIKKLLNGEMITYHEQVTNGVNKKIYSITKSGKEYFETSLSTPMLYKEKNMELSKLFFMGFVDRDKQIASIQNYISELEAELVHLEEINALLSPRFNFNQPFIDNLNKSSNTQEFFSMERIKDIATFQYATLDLGLEKIMFEIEWFKRFKDTLSKEGRRNENQK